MLLFDLLRLLDDQVVPEKCKIHLASRNGVEDPLDVYLEGQFDNWQPWQSKKNFERPMVVSMIALPEKDQWLFTGVYDSKGWTEVGGHDGVRYDLHRRIGPDELDGRLVLTFSRPGRQSYLLGERWNGAIRVVELKPEKLTIAKFPGYSKTMLTKQQLDIVVRHAIESWMTALSAVGGVYVIADRETGKLYIGSAIGVGGVWSRWCDYSKTGHGGNQELRQLLKVEGDDYAKNFHFGILEISDIDASDTDVLRRESHWKELLRTKVPHGYNAN